MVRRRSAVWTGRASRQSIQDILHGSETAVIVRVSRRPLGVRVLPKQFAVIKVLSACSSYALEGVFHWPQFVSESSDLPVKVAIERGAWEENIIPQRRGISAELWSAPASPPLMRSRSQNRADRHPPPSPIPRSSGCHPTLPCRGGG